MSDINYVYYAAAATGGVALLLAVWSFRWQRVSEPRPVVKQKLEEVEADLKEIEVNLGVAPTMMRKIVWHPEYKYQKAPMCIVYVHGWRSSHGDTAPTLRQAVGDMPAHVVYWRLSGHGRLERDGQALDDCGHEDWCDDLIWLRDLASRMGEKIVFVGFSMGGGFSTWLATRQYIDGLILIAPCFAIQHPLRTLCSNLWEPLCRFLMFFILGPKTVKPTLKEDHPLYWTMRFPTVAFSHVFRAVKFLDSIDWAKVSCPVTLICCSRDATVNSLRAVEVLGKFESKRKTIHMIDHAGDAPDYHVISGNVFSPATTAEVAEWVNAGLRAIMAD